MPSIISPATDTQAQDARELLDDLSPPCEYSEHNGSAPAEWIVWFKADCCGPARSRLFCNGCWNRRNTHGWVWCTVCHADLGKPSDPVLRVERI